MAGLPGTGKSTIAQALANQLSGTVLNKDEIRRAIFAPSDIEYSTEQDDFCMEIMLQAAEYILRRDPGRYIFLDGRTFSKRYQIDRVLECADRWKQPWRILECTCQDETAKARFEQTRNHPAGNRDYRLYLGVKNRFEPITLPRTVLNTDTSLDECIDAARHALKT